MNVLLAIGAGGALGSVARYLMSITVQRWIGPSFPLGTVLINILGSFLIGLMYVWFVERTGSSNTLRLFLMVGVLGGFTTFSSFSLETATLMMGSNYGYALLNVALSVVLCVAGTRLGMTLARL
ncbi:MAG TPA: fluoride efflux transporter CrcB [Steroidobacteraceae bacterium]